MLLSIYCSRGYTFWKPWEKAISTIDNAFKNKPKVQVDKAEGIIFASANFFEFLRFLKPQNATWVHQPNKFNGEAPCWWSRSHGLNFSCSRGPPSSRTNARREHVVGREARSCFGGQRSFSAQTFFSEAFCGVVQQMRRPLCRIVHQRRNDKGHARASRRA